MKKPTLEQKITKYPDKINVEIFTLIYKEGNKYIAYCPALELSTFGHSEKEAQEYFADALDNFLEDTIEMGTLEKCLLKFGWALQQNPEVKYEPPRIERGIDFSQYNSSNSKVISENIELPIAC